MIGPCASSGTWATTVRASSATSARDPRSRSSAARTRSGPRGPPVRPAGPLAGRRPRRGMRQDAGSRATLEPRIVAGAFRMASTRTERRLAAILAADVVGYSRLVEQDEEGTLAAV